MYPYYNFGYQPQNPFGPKIFTKPKINTKPIIKQKNNINITKYIGNNVWEEINIDTTKPFYKVFELLKSNVKNGNNLRITIGDDDDFCYNIRVKG